MRPFKIHSLCNIQIHNMVLLSVIAVLFITFMIYKIRLEVCTFPPYPHQSILFSFDFLFYFLISLHSRQIMLCFFLSYLFHLVWTPYHSCYCKAYFFFYGWILFICVCVCTGFILNVLPLKESEAVAKDFSVYSQCFVCDRCQGETQTCWVPRIHIHTAF